MRSASAGHHSLRAAAETGSSSAWHSARDARHADAIERARRIAGSPRAARWLWRRLRQQRRSSQTPQKRSDETTARSAAQCSVDSPQAGDVASGGGAPAAPTLDAIRFAPDR